MKSYIYPFTAIVGQVSMKKALILNIINPRIGGVLINGEKGTGKSTIVRALSDLLNQSIINLPLNITEDRLVGSIDIERTLETGKVHFQEGLFKKAHHRILYVDEVNLLQDHIVDILLEVSANKVNRIEREGISYTHDSDFVLVGTMNSEEGVLRPQFLDRFGLFVNVESSNIAEERVKIMKNIEHFNNNPKEFYEEFVLLNERLREDINNAKLLLDKVIVSEENLQGIVDVCLEANVEGHRGDIIMRETSKAIAAWDGRAFITKEDIQEAAYFALMHRMKENKEQEQEQNQNNNEDKPDDSQEEQQEEQEDTNDGKDTNNENQNQQKQEDNQGQDDDKNENKKESQKKQKGKLKTKVFGIGQEFKVRKFGFRSDKKARNGNGKRTKIRTPHKSGRYVYSTMERTNDDIAFDATIRAAAPFQKIRDKKGMAISIRNEDIREKVRQRKMANLLVFVVDASGSMGANERMVETKGAILSLLKDAYVKRDKIALVVFRGKEAKVILPPTSSAQRAYKLLETMETGGRTPLNDGLQKGVQVIKNELRKNPQIMPMLIVITDGRGNVSLVEGEKPKQELMLISNSIRETKAINSMVIDIEKDGMMKMGIALELSKNLGAEYFKIDNLKANSILNVINEIRN